MKPRLDRAVAFTTIRRYAGAAVTFSKSNTARLSLSYLAIIMVLCVSFSAAIYHTSSFELGRQVPPPTFFGEQANDTVYGFQDFLNQRIHEARVDLAIKLLLLNLFVLIAGAVLSFLLARRTLEPIEQALEAQSRFASDASHELRTPLASIQAENEVALRKPGLTLVRAKEVIASNLEEVIRLRDLSEGLLKLSRSEVRTVPLGSVALQEVATEALNRSIKPAQARRITIQETVPPLRVLAEPHILTQALVILIDNAIKYSPAGTTIYIEAAKAGKAATISVRDEGAGIAESDIPHVFDRFYRADHSRSTQNTSGHGLGLSIAAKIMYQIGGEISVISELDQGSTFAIRLPLAEAGPSNEL